MLSHDVRIWGIRAYKGKKRTTYTLRWSVASSNFPETFTVKALAESRRVELVAAQRRGEPFDDMAGLPESEMRHRLTSVSFYVNAMEFMDMKWPALEPGSRRTLAGALATATLALVDDEEGGPKHRVGYRALSSWAFNKTARGAGQPSDEHAEAIAWIEKHSIPLSALADPKIARTAYNSTTTSHDGKQFAPDTYRNKMKALSGAIKYGIELDRLTSNPLKKICTTPPRRVTTVDRRVVVNPSQARALISEVQRHGPTGPRLVGFFATMYYAGLRPSEVLALRIQDCTLPKKRGAWGSLCLAGSTPYSTPIWTDEGVESPRKALKHRAKNESRTVPACPRLLLHLRAHIEEFGTAEDGRLFFRADGGPLRYATFASVWSQARETVLSPTQCESPLAKRPYDLRHACVSTWLNAGVAAPQVAEWAGHSVEMLLRTYAKCIDGQEDLARKRIEAALEWTEPEPDLDA
ncbi:tyrosine-type recombinase/integrase [Catenulispora pinisilvae]|uniref:tyrosine-type recombinase/integrase n=1 Tax=Catenulispora pinisilvae TaxID=2705253 RepID=UPI00189111F6|nr:tyrosine-type recombinase/integrase [Catenulispora pinisilvae]